MAYFVLLAVAVLFVLLIATRLRPSLLFFSFAFLFLLVDLIDTGSFLSAFSNEALIILLLIIMVARVIEKSTFIDGVKKRLFKSGRLTGTLTVQTLITSVFSAFFNNTAVVAAMIPVVRSNKQIHSSRLLIPLSYAAVLGGTVTLVGTSTNLIINGFVIEAGLKPLGIFDFSAIGIPLAVVGGLYLIFFAHLFLPKESAEQEKSLSEYFVEIKVELESPLIGKSIKDDNLRHLSHLFLAEIIREEELIAPVSPDEVIEAGDVLVFVGEVTNINELKQFDGISIFETPLTHPIHQLQEVMVVPYSNLIGRTVRDISFRSKFNAAVVAVRRRGHRLTGKIGSIKIEAGDILVLSVGHDFYKRDNLLMNFYMLKSFEPQKRLTVFQSVSAVGLFIASIALSALGVVPLLKSLMVAVGVYIWRRWLTFPEIRRFFPFKLLLLVGSALVVGKVMVSSGASVYVANILTLFKGHGPYVSLIGIYLVTALLTELVTNNVAAALIFPIAYSTAVSLGVDSMPFIMAVAFGASSHFLNPFGYQTNVMVFNVGNYRFIDYLKAGFPLAIIYALVVLSLIPKVYPF